MSDSPFNSTSAPELPPNLNAPRDTTQAAIFGYEELYREWRQRAEELEAERGNWISELVGHAVAERDAAEDERDAALDLLRGVVIPRVAGDPSVTERIEAARAFLALVDRVDSGTEPK